MGRYINKMYGPGTGHIWLDNVHCSGTESDIALCSHSAWGDVNCSHSEDVSVSCISPALPSKLIHILSMYLISILTYLTLIVPPPLVIRINCTNYIFLSGYYQSPLFSERVIDVWNALPADVIDFGSVKKFRRSLLKVDLSSFTKCS